MTMNNNLQLRIPQPPPTNLPIMPFFILPAFPLLRPIPTTDIKLISLALIAPVEIQRRGAANPLFELDPRGRGVGVEGLAFDVRAGEAVAVVVVAGDEDASNVGEVAALVAEVDFALRMWKSARVRVEKMERRERRMRARRAVNGIAGLRAKNARDFG